MQAKGIEVTARGRKVEARGRALPKGRAHKQGLRRLCGNLTREEVESSLAEWSVFRVPVKCEVFHSQHERWC